MIFFFLGSSNGWLVGDSKYIFATHDTGKSWVKYNTKISEDLNQIQFVTELIGWIVSDGGLYKSHDGGITWYSQLGFETISKCYYVNETTGWVIVSSPFYSLLLTKDGGENWSIQI
ncbi:MAG: WD40/YVTN/BNR-like repeat-containing protein, partial [Candidatus Helarchaeota archaeon]